MTSIPTRRQAPRVPRSVAVASAPGRVRQDVDVGGAPPASLGVLYRTGGAIGRWLCRSTVRPGGDAVTRAVRLRESGVTVRPYSPDRMTAPLAFMSEHMPWDWGLEVRERLRDGTRGLLPAGAIQPA